MRTTLAITSRIEIVRYVCPAETLSKFKVTFGQASAEILAQVQPHLKRMAIEAPSCYFDLHVFHIWSTGHRVENLHRDKHRDTI